MKLTYVTTYNASNIQNWSGIGYYMAKALQDAFIPLNYIGSLHETTSSISNIKQRAYARFLKQVYLLDRDPIVLRSYAAQVAEQLSQLDTDIVFSPGTIPIAFLECEQPLVVWTDCTFGGMTNFYPGFSNLCWETINHGNSMERIALEKCKLVIYSSEISTFLELKRILLI
jgi:hypothetical protein